MVAHNTYTYYHSRPLLASQLGWLTEMASQDTQMKSLQGLEELKQEANSAIENQNRKENQTLLLLLLRAGHAQKCEILLAGLAPLVSLVQGCAKRTAIALALQACCITRTLMTIHGPRSGHRRNG